MPKAQKTNWAGYWEPTPRNQVTTSRADRPTSIYDRDIAFRQSQRDALIIAPWGGVQQRSQKRGEDFVTDDDSDGEVFHTPKARCMTIDETDEEDNNMAAQDSRDETEQHQENENATSLTIPINRQFLSGIQERLATMENKMQSLDKTTEKHVGDIDYLLPQMKELTSVGQVAMKRVDILAKSLVTANDNMWRLADEQEACNRVSREVLLLCNRLVGLVEKTKKDLNTTRMALEETRAARAEDRAAIFSLRQELLEMRGEGSTST